MCRENNAKIYLALKKAKSIHNSLDELKVQINDLELTYNKKMKRPPQPLNHIDKAIQNVEKIQKELNMTND